MNLSKREPNATLLSAIDRIPTVGGKDLDLHKLFVEVTSRGGIEKVCNFIPTLNIILFEVIFTIRVYRIDLLKIFCLFPSSIQKMVTA